MERQKHFVQIILLSLLVLVMVFWGNRSYHFMQVHPLANRVYRYQASSAVKSELTNTPNDYQYVVFGAGKYRGQCIRVDNQKQLRQILNHRQAYQTAFAKNGIDYIVRQQRLQMDLENEPTGEGYVQRTKKVWVAQQSPHDVGGAASSLLRLTSMHPTRQTVSAWFWNK